MKTLFFLLSIFMMIGMTGCATTNLQAQAKMTRSITLMPDQLNDKKVYLRVTGTEASKIELEEPLAKALIERGVFLTSAEDANFYLHINTLFADNLKEAANLNATLLGGAAAGAIATVNNSGGNSIWNDPTTLDTFETVQTVDNDLIKEQEREVFHGKSNKV